MREYELMAVYDLAVAEEGGQDASVQHLTGLVERNGGSVKEVDHWGRRRLAYPMNKQLDADFVVTRIMLDPEAVKPLNADFQIEERVYRHLVVRADELPEPRPMLAPAGPRGDGGPTGPPVANREGAPAPPAAAIPVAGEAPPGEAAAAAVEADVAASQAAESTSPPPPADGGAADAPAPTPPADTPPPAPDAPPLPADEGAASPPETASTDASDAGSSPQADAPANPE